MTVPVAIDDFLVFGRDWWLKPCTIPRNPSIGPLGCCELFTLFDGRRIVVPGRPIVIQELNAEAWVKAIAEILRPLPPKYHEFYSNELLHHAEVAKGSLWALINDRSPVQFGLVLREIAGQEFDGCTLKQIGVDDRKRNRWLMVFDLRG